MTKDFNLRQLIDTKPSKDAYDDYINKLVNVITEKFNNQQDFKLSVSDDPKQYNTVNLTLNKDEFEEGDWDYLVDLVFYTNLDNKEANKQLPEALAKTLHLGRDITIVAGVTVDTEELDKPEYIPLTGADQITKDSTNSAVNVTFIKSEDKEEFLKAAQDIAEQNNQKVVYKLI